MNRMKKAFAVMAVTTSSMMATGFAFASEYYAGETIRIIVPFSAGGGTDTFGRLIANNLGKFIPGNPTVIAENVTGAGGLLGSNEFADRVDRDGKTLLTASGHLNLRAFLGLEGLTLNLAELTPVVATPMGHVTAVNVRAANVANATDVLTSGQRLTKGITDPIGLVESLVALEMFNLQLRTVPGYGGRGDTRVGFERGELIINSQSSPAYNSRVQPLVDEGIAQPLWAIGFIDEKGYPMRDPAVPHLRTGPEVYLDTFGRWPSGDAWDAYKVVANLVQNTRGTIWVHTEAPPAAHAALRAGVDAMVADPQFLESSAKILSGYNIISGSGLDAIRADLDAAPQSVVDWVQNLLSENYGVRFNP